MFKNRSKTVHVGNYRIKAFYCADKWWCMAEERMSNIPADVKYNSWVGMFLIGNDDWVTRDIVLEASLRLIQAGLAETHKAYLTKPIGGIGA